MTSEVVQAHPDTPFEELARLLDAHRISGLPVVDRDDKVMGVVSQSDLTKRQAARGGPGTARHRILRTVRGMAHVGRAPVPAVTACEVMTSPAVTVHPEQRVVDAARIMERRHIDRLPVVDEEDRLIGITTRRDLLRVFLRTDEEIRSDVLDTAALHRPAQGVADQLRIDVHDGVVTMAGRLPPDTDTSGLIRAAWRVDGVVGVVNRLAETLPTRKT
ncbi:CBS domain-containing protein [Streptomyces finlayi]|uniref:CBS domain-containing protein n=1 Tax=Streptomyces finlayi TaxID=67296 RepID=A0A7G7BDI3_9ACTN|nr:CBS domain-containing protein [Streptomyces finlayi]QNE73398.1 CBS domain-containing protein [Streptomyces finlayi]